MRSGDKRTTLADVAAEAGVSVALVSIVMRGAPGAGAATRERVQEVAHRLGYQPDSRARLLRSGRSRLLGVVFDVRHPFHHDLLTGLYDAAERAGYQLTLSAVTARRGERTAVGDLLQDRCEAIVLFGGELRSSELASIAARLPVVAMMRGVRRKDVDVVHNDDALGSHQAVDHLVSLGHRRITHIDGDSVHGSVERRTGYQEAMRRHGLDQHIRVIPGGAGEDDGARAAEKLLADPPTAVTVFNDLGATGLLDVLHRNGLRVPGDVSVVGYDDTSLSRLAHIDLTTIAQDVDAMATRAVQRAVERIEGTPTGLRSVIIAPRLVVRGTTGPPAG
ncbi:LacI family DNA-binding transcriptional regulator [Actinoplanes derwentensis]|uniref:DNA-binding transcriptional regulator, LacI/PurR family n=1 Tax=Actinoplanes derwentensis TaxID=113562 RepID=A0A1H1QTV8_9ACTN|nr:LacI family DNA-binding transcriptional regulator [Actinoplanes derwentensis]GID89335.1 LacI family transcriptional regulator [Actinoplanes derwentensis]SDS26743.1 DNA-binding transcriptional regulator, LacI/PurR family [Actinoplanes derwentensis]